MLILTLNYRREVIATMLRDAREDLLAFYAKHYSANQMTLVVLGREPLDELQAMVSARFGAVENRRAKELTRVPPLFDRGTLLAEEIASRAPVAVRDAKRMINHSYDSFLSDGLAEEKQAFYNLFGTADQKEGMNAFIEKRAPNWTGK